MSRLRGTITRVPSFRAVDMPTDSSSPFNVDKEKLMQLAKSKNQDMLRELGGVDGIILSLKTHADYGIRGDAADLRNRINFFNSNSSRIRAFGCMGGTISGKTRRIPVASHSPFTVISATIEKAVELYFDKAIKGSQLVIALRNGLGQQVPVSSILVGDIALLKKGDEIPADGLLLEASGDLSLKTDESNDGKIVEISYSEPFLHAGAKVVEGQAKMMVTSTVVGTDIGGVYEMTELRTQINYLIRFLEIMKWVLALSSFPITVSRYFSGKSKHDNENILLIRQTTSLEISYIVVQYIAAAGVIFVAMDTSNFSWALKVCLAHAINMMAASNVIVRNLSSWERIGLGVATMNVTGELNALKQSVSSEFLFAPQITEDKKSSSHISTNVLPLIQQGIGLNTTGISNHSQGKCEIKFLGSASERAFLSHAALKSKMDWEKLINDCAIVKVENLGNQGRVILVKRDDSLLEHRRGPAEMIVAMCWGYYDDVGILRPLNEDTRSLLQQKLQSMECDIRTQVIALACREVPNRGLKDDSNSDTNEDCYNLLGFVVLMGASQDEIVQDVAQECGNAGLDLNFFHDRNLHSPGQTGTNRGQGNEILALGRTTGETEATECGCGNQSKETRESFKEVNLDNGTEDTEPGETEMNQVSQDSLSHDADNHPSSEATESISVAIQGDETTATSDIIILDGKITGLSFTLMWAKGLLLNTRAFTQFQLTIMIASIADAFVRLVSPVKTAGLNKTLAYEVVQQIWVGTGMGLIAVTTFGRQRPRPSTTLLQKPPEKDKMWIITGYMLRNIATQAAYQITAASVLQFRGSIFGFDKQGTDTATFVVPIFLQALNMISARKFEEKNIFSGTRPWLILLLAALTVVPFVLVEVLARIGYFRRLQVKEWAICITIALASWPVGFAAKFVPVGLFVVPVRLVAAPIMAVAYRLEEAGNRIRSTASKFAFWLLPCFLRKKKI
ncbi:calcium-transporting ATPase 13, plasma membrane-type [Dorcoceras hygrometricum]|uniref:Calcium-transporting ATPase 13, plasma membrane-type n=1 Tax=Dorcoceras hygrometricum TaxID=472368 RepID=A0A2Z7B324_9LAMI|nr:calcium-transporting ATPase 13, plasma membrane-type [Dorcoceras hygrometricum]